MPKIDLRNRNKPVAPFPTAPAAAAVLPGENRMPLPMGQMVPATLTPAEKRQLEELGVKAGQPVPGNLAELVEAAKREAMAENLNAPPPAPLGTPPLELPTPIPISQLPPAKQAEIAAAIRDAGVHHRAQQSVAAAQLDPSVRAAVQAGLDAQRNAPPETVIVDDRNSDRYADTNELKTPPTATPEPEHAPQQHCPHCGWDQEVLDPVIATDEDKRTFLAALLGGANWKKAFSLMGGKLEVVVRNLSTTEVDLCYQQAYREGDRGQLNNSKEFAEQVNRYRMTLQLVSIKGATGLTVVLGEGLSDWDVTPGEGDTVLPEIMRYVYETAMPNEAIHRIVAGVVANFNRLATKLEVNVENPDFWDGIALPL